METEHGSLSVLEDEVTSARASSISSNPRASYLSSTTRFLEWMFTNKRSVIHDSFANAIVLDANGKATRNSIKAALSSAPSNPPIHFDRITAREIMTWIVSMKNANGTYHSFSTYAGHHYHQVMSLDLARELSSHFKGFQRKVAAAVSQGRGQIKVGKDPMPLGLYKRIATAMLTSPLRDMIFARTFMILSWNLMSRAANTASVCYGHLEWLEDALCVYFAHMKNDQRGSRPRDPRHVYSNPTAPEICPILALGKKVLGRVLKTTSVADELERRGTNASDIGTHSMRKGASTFCSSGSTACPPAVAVHLRAGWSMGGVQDRYLRHDAAGDMFAGRTVSGLPILQPEFAILPPHFAADDEVVQRAKRLCFSGLPKSVEFVAEFAPAALIYHLGFLREHLPSIVKTSGTGCEIQPTGVPPHVTILAEIREARNELREEIIARKADMQNITESQDALCGRMVSGVSEILEERVCQSGVPTCNSMADSIMKRLEDAGVLQLCDLQSKPAQTVVRVEVLDEKIELRAHALGLSTTKVSFDEAIDVFQQWKDVIDLPPETTNSRKRRRGQLVWVSAATILRKQAKVARSTPANASTNPH
ncbi:hypothetical protein GQ600_4359 [Phytophthora cactorum]|nr:hypothetical protein GQ600_4359 [Phytophthora cactorum]